VVCVDNLSTGFVENLARISSDSRFRFLNADVTEPFPLEGRFDAVCHLASPASVPAYLTHPLETLAAGSEGSRRLLEVAAAHGARFLLASTSEIYGDPEVHPQTEGYRGNVDPVGPRSVYDEAKRFAEAITMAMHRSRGVDVCIARIFNGYGPRLSPRDGRVVSNFIFQAATGRPLTIYGDGTQTRSLCYIDDLVSGLLGLLDSQATGPVNIGNPEEISMTQLAAKVLEITGSSSGVEHRPLPKDDPRRRCPDVTLARRLLGWVPTVGLDEGLRRTVAWYRALPASHALRQSV
jgi:dTDP-glucose 4,6-dehydratase